MSTGEQTIEEIAVRTNLLYMWLRTRLQVTNRRLTGVVPNTVLGVIPAGTKKVTQPLDRISNVSIDVGYSFFKGIIGVVFVLLGLNNLPGGVLLIAIGAAFLAHTVQARLVVADSSGRDQVIPVSLLDRSTVERFAETVNGQVSSTGHHQPLLSNHAPQANGALEGLTQLHELLTSGAITQDEYDVQKSRILETG